MNYLGSSQQNYYTDGGRKNMKGRERKDRMKIGVDGKIPQDKKT